MSPRLLLLVSVALLASSCIQLPEPTDLSDNALPFELPKAWSAETTPTESPDDPWWFEINSVQLNALVEEGLTSSPTVGQALERVWAAVARAQGEGAALSPTLDLNAGVSRQVNQFFLPGLGPQTNRTFTHSLGLNLSWEVDLWGRLRASQRASQLDAESQHIALYGAQLSLSGQVTKGYFALLVAQRQLHLAEQDLERASTLAERIEDRYRNGLRSALDLRRTEAERSRVQATVETRRNQVDRSRRQLEILLGRYPSGRIELDAELPELADAIPPGLPADLLTRRPDLLQVQVTAWSQGYRQFAAEQARLPRIALTASGGTVTEDLGDILDRDFGVWSFAGNLAMPLLDGGRLQSTVDQASANLRETQARFVETALRAFGEVEVALNAAQTLQRSERALAASQESAAASLELSEARYLGGVIDLLDVLEARRTLYSTETELLQTRLERLNNRVDLHLALGGGYQHSPPEDSDPQETRE